MEFKLYKIEHTKYASKIIGELVNAGNRDFVIYPFGMHGKMVKSVLNTYFGIEELMVVDNFLCKEYEKVKSLNDLGRLDLTNVTILIAYDGKEEIRKELCEELYKVVSKDKCIELFPKVYKFHYTLNENEKFTHRYFLKEMAMRKAAEYIAEYMEPTATRFADRYKMFEYIFWEKLRDISGLCLEFGVMKGESINFTATLKPMTKFYGFDAFEGLPEDWTGSIKKGAYTTKGLIPDTCRNVELVRGWFDETLPQFLQEHSENVSFIHIDCDLYSSTKTVLTLLKERIVPGTIIQFDEFIGGVECVEHEFKAFHEFIEETGYDFEYLGYTNIGKQVSVIIK